MLAEESERVCSKSPEKTAADLGTCVPFNHAGPAVYNMAEAVSSPIICKGNKNASKQQTIGRKADDDMTGNGSRMLS